jgi:methionine sulfoxide reductase catalytic subunit
MPSEIVRRPGRIIGRRSFLALAALGLISLAEGCSQPPISGPTFGPSPVTTSIPLSTPLSPSGFKATPSPVQDFNIETAESEKPVDLSKWSVRVDGLVSQPMSWNIDQLLALPAVIQTSGFRCVEGWEVTTVKWEGVRLHTLLDAAGIKPEAKYVVFHTIEGVYSDGLSLDQALRSDVLLAYAADDAPLAEKQGFPLRLVVSPMLGYKSVKWVNRLELVDKEYAGYWEVRGYEINAWR